MYTKSIPFYDVIYAFKDYPTEAQLLIDIIREHLQSGGERLLDVRRYSPRPNSVPNGYWKL